ncbi:MAG TPA: flagellar hook-length control protein FliK [Candidatus Deferrimicrobium sp.]
MCFSNPDPAPEGTRGAEGARRKKDDTSARIEGQSEPATTPPADGKLGVAEKLAPPRPVGPASDPGIVRFEEKAFVITRKSDTSVEVTLAPPGVGKLEIEVVLEKGVVNARILAADSAGREAIARSLPQIVEALARDGMNVGGFTVSLKERRDRTGGEPGHGALRDPDSRLLSAVTQAASASAASAGLVDIFV